ncbi:protein CDV3 homolog [Aricia agestis]|uniref:protein CDV3 homolog n=1 Tax=Aricia agestis TaxID=91739 RepID=UPI001C2034CC|nr:protein CDV3 homolog [Aricia agestis]XP_041982367.1 protein CDV3 homolog [Aricia agestis]
MADLDDFFAKKDRKKSKSKKFATSDELAKKMDDPKQKPDVKPKKERPVQEGEEPGRAGEDEEWKDYEEPVKDYTGLKIQVLQGGTGVPESGRDTATEDSNTDSTKVKGPWNKPVDAEPAKQAPPPPPEEPRPTPTVYVPPSQRLNDAPVRRPHATKNAPDIHNDDYFPVLGSAGKRGGWSTAGGGGPQRSAPAAARPLALDNRFTSLPHDS